MSQSFFYIANVFEDTVRSQRRITTDSPAANRKVSQVCQAVRQAGGDARIISLGRGRSVGTLRRFAATATSIGKVPISYLDFWDVPVLTHAMTMISLCLAVLRLTERSSVLVFYNCQFHYVLALLAGRLLGRTCILDIEDGYRSDDKSIRNLPNAVVVRIFNACCNGGAQLASSALKAQTPARQTLVCYGVSDPAGASRDWSGARLQVLLGGSLYRDTGAELFLQALALLQAQSPSALRRFHFVVTGFGDFAAPLQQAAAGDMADFLSFQGNLSAGAYRKILADSHLGLCLKLPDSSMGATTFPSKVVELASSGLLVVSTRVSDVGLIFDDQTACLLETATPQALAAALFEIAQAPGRARDKALKGQQRVASLLSEEKVGAEVLRFWRGDYAAS